MVIGHLFQNLAIIVHIRNAVGRRVNDWLNEWFFAVTSFSGDLGSNRIKQTTGDNLGAVCDIIKRQSTELWDLELGLGR